MTTILPHLEITVRFNEGGATLHEKTRHHIISNMDAFLSYYLDYSSVVAQDLRDTIASVLYDELERRRLVSKPVEIQGIHDSAEEFFSKLGTREGVNPND